jgi:hypothetical protein
MNLELLDVLLSFTDFYRSDRRVDIDFLPWRPGLNPGWFYVKFEVDEVALEHVFLEDFFGFPPLIIILPLLRILI